MVKSGCVDNIKYRNPDNGYTVFELVDSEEKKLVTCVGSFSYLAEGEYVRLEGNMTKHPIYGEQFSVTSFSLSEPEDALSMQTYLASGAIKGIGKRMAGKIVERFGADTFRIIEEEPECLADIKGISERMAREISAQFMEKQGQRSAMMFLQQYGISPNLAVKIYKRYGSGMYSVLKENPYRMAEDISGVGFKTADEIASRAGISRNSSYRIRAGILYALSLASTTGHTYLPKDRLKTYTAELLNVDSDEIEREIDRLMFDRSVISYRNAEGETCLYSSVFYYTELNVARMLLDLNIKCKYKEAELEKKLKKIEKSFEIELDELQHTAVKEAAGNGVFVLTGGPGTGKTTTINTIIHFFESEGEEILLAAPTGRAAKRIYETTGHEAVTIHRLLEIKPKTELSLGKEVAESGYTFERNEDNPLEADVVIIDEMSMVDIHLMHALLKAISIGTRLIMVGDVNQLPSVGPGNVLRDIIESGRFNVVKLNKIFRQAAVSDIVKNAHMINAGEMPLLDNKSKDFFFMPRTTAEEIAGVVVALVRDKLPGYVDSRPFDIQVLTPMRKGELGVENLNRILQRYLNPESPSKLEKEHHDTIFREGDKVMQIKNNYQAVWEQRNSKGYLLDSGSGIFNGDCGVIKSINPYSEEVVVEFDEGKTVVYSYSQLDELETAYAVTIHKSQGSEYPAIVIPLLSGPAVLFNRNLLYTAVTRAKKCVTIVGNEKAVERMVTNANELKRYSGLKEHIIELSKG